MTQIPRASGLMLSAAMLRRSIAVHIPFFFPSHLLLTYPLLMADEGPNLGNEGNRGSLNKNSGGWELFSLAQPSRYIGRGATLLGIYDDAVCVAFVLFRGLTYQSTAMPTFISMSCPHANFPCCVS
ncbi:hypothetical protein GE21DRAFT_1113435 [Neurospora crassa]|nr:hypothetical protein GE21DRAFT_1113435 [Neurospora crassa]